MSRVGERQGRTLGIIGGIAPGSTIEYYRLIVALYRAARPGGGYPHLIINSIDLEKMLNLVAGSRLDDLAAYLAAEVNRLAAAGADVGLLASNTPHLVFEELRRRSPISLISIVEAARAAALRLGLTRVALLGTRFTMEARFYPEVFSAGGIAVVVPTAEERAYVHDRYMGELVQGTFRAATRRRMTMIVERLAERDNAQGVVLGGTELSLLFREGSPTRVPFLDTTRIHAECAVAELLSP